VSVLTNARNRRAPRSGMLRLLATGLLGVAAAALASCGSSGNGLIPLANAGPLQSDFEEVAQAAQAGGGNCGPTITALDKTEHDFALLPGSIDPGLRETLSKGITNLRERALALCAQPPTQTGAATTPSRATTTTKTQSTTTTPSPAQTTGARTTPTTPSTSTPSGTGGVTAAPSGGTGGENAGGGSHEGNHEGSHEGSHEGGAGVSEAGGQEAGK